MKTIKRMVAKNTGRPAFYLFDLSIPDLHERREKALTFPSARAMCLEIGLGEMSVHSYTSKQAIAKQKRFYSEKHMKTYAIRAASSVKMPLCV